MMKGKSEVWNFCSKLSDGTAACNICGQSLRGAKGGNTSTLWSHLESKHTIRRPGAYRPDQSLYSALAARQRPEEEHLENEDSLLRIEGVYVDRTRKSTGRKCKAGTGMREMKAEEAVSFDVVYDCNAAPTENSTIFGEADNSNDFTNEDSTLPIANESTSVGSNANLNTAGPSRTSPSKKSLGFLSYIRFLKHKEERVAKHKRDVLSLKEKKLQLESEKLQFERTKFEFERRERETKLQIEISEHEHRISMEKKQLEIIETLTKMVNKN